MQMNQLDKAIELCELGSKLDVMVKKYNKYDAKIRNYTPLKDLLGKEIAVTKKRMKELGWKEEFE